MNVKIRCGTRGSALALAQSDEVARRLRELHSGLEIERIVIHTSGDRFAAQASAKPMPASVPNIESAFVWDVPNERSSDVRDVNVKAMFVKEIEEALLAGTIDFAVHSCKDLPAELPGGLCIAAYPPREDPRDVYIGGAKTPFWDRLKSGDRVGTAALRRQIQLRMAKPGIECVPIRGNVDTRLKKLEEGTLSGIVLAKAGLKRLGREAVSHEVLPAEVVVPAPGQGALALEARSDRADILKLLASLNDPGTKLTVECERAFMRAIGGGCRSPLGAYAVHHGDHVRLDVFWSDADGRRPVHRRGVCDADPAKLAAFAAQLAQEILRQ